MKTLAWVGGTMLVAVMAAPASAIPTLPDDSNFPANYDAIAFAARGDTRFFSGSGGHALWFSSGTAFGTKSYIFDVDAGIGAPGDFKKTGDTATLTGHVVRGNMPSLPGGGPATGVDTNFGFNISATFRYIGDGRANGEPIKAELQKKAYVVGFDDEDGDAVGDDGSCVGTISTAPEIACIDPNTQWSFFQLESATLTGTDNYEGLVISLTQRGPFFQTGFGANNKNGDTGLSGWFNWDILQNMKPGCQVNCEVIAGLDQISNRKGDFNIDWDVVVPEPATVTLLGAGLLGLVGLRRRRRG